MPKTKEQKQEIIKDLQEKVKKQKASVFIDLGPTNAKSVFQFRDELKKAGCLLQVVKKTLLEKVLEQAQETEILKQVKTIKGQMAIVFGFTDEVSPAKISFEASKKNEQIKILAGVLGEEFLEQGRVVELAKLPTKPELLGKLLGTLQAPVSNFVYVLNGNIKGLVCALDAITKKKQ